MVAIVTNTIDKTLTIEQCCERAGAAIRDGEVERSMTDAVSNHKQVETVVWPLSSEKLP